MADVAITERMRARTRAIEALPEGGRVTFLMHDVEGFKHAEIGAMLGIPEGTVKSRCSRGRARLAVVLAPLLAGQPRDVADQR